MFKLWLNHGDRPSDQSYEYIVVPPTTTEELEQIDAKNNVEIISNTAEIQAVFHSGLKICQAVFYKSGEVRISGQLKLKSDAPGLVMLKMAGEKVKQISVLDPNREMDKMHLSISERIEKDGDTFRSHWNEEEKISELSIQLPCGVYAGQSVNIEF